MVCNNYFCIFRKFCTTIKRIITINFYAFNFAIFYKQTKNDILLYFRSDIGKSIIF